MPAKSKRQQRFMGRCLQSGGEGCPPKKVAREFARNPKTKVKKKTKARKQ